MDLQKEHQRLISLLGQKIQDAENIAVGLLQSQKDGEEEFDFEK